MSATPTKTLRFGVFMATSLAIVTILGACATANPDVIRRRDAQMQSQVYDAVVLSVRRVRIEGSQSGAGTATGAVVGGLAGSTAGGGRGKDVATALGVIGGAVAGNLIEKSATTEEAVELLIQLPNGERRSIVQGIGQEEFRPGEAVMVVVRGATSRVIKGVAPMPSTVPATPVRN